ncbi:MAG: extracellular solute-binding protein [Candidatus Marinimicrobia bacterium]|nr:extracellular solute-binding protein [Candidatus Neomarinimicrobiota bacterium]
MINRLMTLLIYIAIYTIVMSCRSSKVEVDAKNVEYWTAPSVELSRFESKMVEKWNSSHPDSPIDWKTIPAGTTSEEVLLTAIATRTGPDICSNIFGGFAAQLADAQVLVALDTLPGFWDVMEKRKMTNIIRNNWFYKGHVYVIPVYVNPEMIWYNKKMLDKSGITKLPRTYSEFFTLLENVCISQEVYGLTVDVSSKWYRRWFDYLTLYAAASGGEPYLDVNRKEAFFNNEAGIAVTEFFFKVFEKGYAPRFEIQDGFQKELFFASIKGAGEIVRTKRMYPDLEYVITPLLVPDYYPNDAPVYTLAESKGMVLFNTSQQKGESWDFMKWYFSGEHDSLWLELTNFLPAREDLIGNPIFIEYFNNNPDIKLYAETLDFSVPLVLTPQTVEIQTILNRELWQPIIFGLKSPAIASRDANQTIQRILKSGP